MLTGLGARRDFGPVNWARRNAGRKRAQEGSDRRVLVERVQQFLLQANDGNAVFSVYEKSETHGGSQFKVTTYTYYPRVLPQGGAEL